VPIQRLQKSRAGGKQSSVDDVVKRPTLLGTIDTLEAAASGAGSKTRQ
jgi:hypothetical protein